LVSLAAIAASWVHVFCGVSMIKVLFHNIS
jgi:hypothetical protein